jgi:hypothetical protein
MGHGRAWGLRLACIAQRNKQMGGRRVAALPSGPPADDAQAWLCADTHLPNAFFTVP